MDSDSLTIIYTTYSLISGSHFDSKRTDLDDDELPGVTNVGTIRRFPAFDLLEVAADVSADVDVAVLSVVSVDGPAPEDVP